MADDETVVCGLVAVDFDEFKWFVTPLAEEAVSVTATYILRDGGHKLDHDV